MYNAFQVKEWIFLDCIFEVATNLCLWIRTLIDETLHAFGKIRARSEKMIFFGDNMTAIEEPISREEYSQMVQESKQGKGVKNAKVPESESFYRFLNFSIFNFRWLQSALCGWWVRDEKNDGGSERVSLPMYYRVQYDFGGDHLYHVDHCGSTSEVASSTAPRGASPWSKSSCCRLFSFDRSIDWLIDQYVDWFFDWLIDWPICWLIFWLAEMLIDFLIDCTWILQTSYAVDCDQAAKGLFVGIIIVVLTIVSLILYFIFLEKPAFTDMAVTQAQITEIVLYGIGLTAVAYCFVQITRNLKRSRNHNISSLLDETLLKFSMVR